MKKKINFSFFLPPPVAFGEKAVWVIFEGGFIEFPKIKMSQNKKNFLIFGFFWGKNFSSFLNFLIF